MSEYILYGHLHQRRTLEVCRSSTTPLLLEGPPGVGKWTFGRQLYTEHALWNWVGSDHADWVSTVDQIRHWLADEPPGDVHVKAALIGITLRSPEELGEALTLLVEGDRPPWFRVMLHVDGEAPDLPVLQRCTRVRFGLLSPSDLAAVLYDYLGWDLADAVRWSDAGSTKRAARCRDSAQALHQVSGLVRAAADRSEALLSRVADSWSEDATFFLGVWLAEYWSDPRLFSLRDLVFPVERVDRLLRVYDILREHQGAHRLQAKAIFPFLVR